MPLTHAGESGRGLRKERTGMARRISDEERIVEFFRANIGTERADTVYNIVRGMYRTTSPVKPARKRRVRRTAPEPVMEVA